MKPPPFTYAAPRTTGEALALLGRHGHDAKVIAGGQSLVPLLNFRLARPAVLIDLAGVGGLDTIAYDEATGEVVLGALVRQADAERSPLVGRHLPLLVSALRHIGHRTIRNRGTIGGSLAHADPAAELPLTLVALDGRVKLLSSRGERWLPARGFFLSYLTTALGPDELLIEARFPALHAGVGWGFTEFSRRSGDFALAAACATLGLTGGWVERPVVAIAGGGPTPLRAAAAERALAGAPANDEAFGAAAALAAGACEIDSDIHASAEYRRELIATMVRRALHAAAASASAA